MLEVIGYANSSDVRFTPAVNTTSRRVSLVEARVRPVVYRRCEECSQFAGPSIAWAGVGGLAWAGLFNTYFWPDPNKRVTGTTMTQLLPFADDQVLKQFAKFESGLYAAVA